MPFMFLPFTSSLTHIDNLIEIASYEMTQTYQVKYLMFTASKYNTIFT